MNDRLCLTKIPPRAGFFLVFFYNIISTKGKGGGIRINPASSQLKLGDIVKMLEPNMDLVECFNEEENTCKITAACDLKSILFKAKLNFIDYLNQYTLDDLNKHNLVQVLEIK